jgi:polyisoprenyl-phosphate glycosyltransferase
MSQLLAPNFIGTSRRPGTDNSERSSANARSVTNASGVIPVGRETEPTVSCVVPCRNEAENLALLLPLLSDALTEAARSWEVILIDDGSTDNTAMLLQGWSRIPGFRVLQLSRNFGKEAALTAGLEAAAGDVVIMMDADLQHSPALIPTFIRHWQQGADVAYAVRQDRSDEGRFKRVGTRWFYALVNAADRFEVPAGAGDFRLMDRRVVDALLALPERNRFMKGLYAWVGFKAVAVPYVPEPRAHGRSHFSPWRLIRLSIDGLTAFTTWPLRAVSMLGFALALLAFLYGGYLTASFLLYGHAVSGWTTIVVSLMLFAGIQLLSLGIVGEYVGRIFEEVKGRPLFIIQRELGQGLRAARP